MKIILMVFVFFVKIAAFGLVYYCLFVSNPLSFYVNQSIKSEDFQIVLDNSNTFSKVSDVKAVEVPDAIDLPAKALYQQIQDKAKKISPKIIKYSNLDNEIKMKNSVLDTLIDEANKSNSLNLKKALEKGTADLIARKTDLNNKFLEIGKETDKYDEMSVKELPSVRASKLKYEVAKLNQKIAEKKVEIYDSRDLMNWADPSLRNKVSRRVNDLRKLDQEKYNLHFKIIDDVAKYKEEVRRVKRVLSSSLNYLDFLYFSTITATTVGYGDISPNGRIARLIVMLQSLLSVIFVGYLVHLVTLSFGGSKTPPKSDENQC
jgi:hypothetical protein